MQNYSIIITNGVFFKSDNDLVNIVSPTLAKVGDWECSIANNSLKYICSSTYGLNSKANLKYIIKSNGFSRLVLTLPHTNPIIRKKKWLAKPGKFNLHGVLTLSSGEISHRFAHFKIIDDQK